MPPVEGAVTHASEPHIAGRIIAEQDVVSPGAVEITHADDGIVRVGAIDVILGGKDTVTHRLEPHIARRVVAEQDVRWRPIGVKAADADDGIGSVRDTDLLPAGERPIADDLEPGIPGRIVAEENVLGAGAVEIGVRSGSCVTSNAGPNGDAQLYER